MAKTKTPAVDTTTRHIYGATGLNWAVGQTREEVLKKLAADAGENCIKANVAKSGGLFVWTCIVDLPQSAPYQINFYQPVDVPTRDIICFRLRNARGTHVIEEQEPTV